MRGRVSQRLGSYCGRALVVVSAFSAMRCTSTPPPATPPPPVVIRVLEAATSTDQIGAGGWDSAVTRRFFAPRLWDCGPRVLRAATDWASAGALTVVKRDVEPGRVLVHVRDADQRGYHEILYRLEAGGHRARISFLHYDQRGAASEPAALAQGAARLIADLEAALTCTGD